MRTATALGLYVAVCGAAIALDAAHRGQAGFWLVPVVTILVAATARRWWLVLLPVWVPIAAAIAWAIEPSPGDTVDSAWSAALFVLIFGTLPLAFVTAVSVAVAKLVVVARRERAVHVSG